MSFIVYGVKIPVSCDSCPLMRWNDYGIDGELQYCNRLNAICEHEEEQRDADCLLGELPPHGRLIDADALKLTFSDGINEDGILYVPFRDIAKSIENAPTIIEAEEEDNGN